jgi:hypothetical protein
LYGRTSGLLAWQTGKLNYFSDATFIAASAYIDNEFANGGKLSGKVANSFWQQDALLQRRARPAAHRCR